MPHKGSKRAALIMAALASVFAAAPAAHAQLIAADSYRIGPSPAAGEYQNNVSFASQGSVVIPGFQNPPNNMGGSGTSQFQTTTSGLVYSALGVTAADSGKITYINAPLDAFNRSTARNLQAPVPASGTYWVGHMLNRGPISPTAPTGRDFVGTGFGNATFPTLGGTNLAGLYVGFQGDAGNLVFRHRNTAGITVDTLLIDATSTNLNNLTLLVVAQINVNTSGTTDTVNWWVNPTDFTSVATLNATALVTSSFTGDPITNAASFGRLNYASFRYNLNAFFDEPRLGTTLANTFPAASAAAPEPGTFALALMGGAGFIGLRRRRRA